MNDQVKPTSFTVACKQFFGFAPGQTLMEFRDEVNQLTPQDREDMKPGLEAALGVKIA